MRRIVRFILFLLSGTVISIAGECPGNPNALGTSRVIVVDPAEHPRVGTLQYQETLPLNDHEVVLTFDDGPLPPYTTRILDTLASDCVKATFFIIGRMANSSPDLVQRAYREGHTIGTHTENHPLNIASLPVERTEREIQDGIASVTRALGGSAVPAPFFRIPGLERTEAIEKYLATRGIMIWSADVIPDDWKQISPDQVIERSLEGLKHKGRGILLLHDIHERTAEALPRLLSKLKLDGFHIGHVVPVSPDRPKTVTVPTAWTLHIEEKNLDPSAPTE
ncbi:MAG: polysaccharide deacetylase family protein [Bradyrhizobium sp.]|nr:polysaccharide deacetylase family protein [Bradyrhizobium sp.]